MSGGVIIRISRGIVGNKKKSGKSFTVKLLGEL